MSPQKKNDGTQKIEFYWAGEDSHTYEKRITRTYLVYNTVVRLCQFFCCGGKVNFVRIPYSHDRFSKISRTFFVKKMISYETYVREDQLFLALYGSTTIQSLLFLKISRTLFDFLNNTYWFSLFLRNNSLIFWTGVSCFSVSHSVRQ